jgi:hypothetical protein
MIAEVARCSAKADLKRDKETGPWRIVRPLAGDSLAPCAVGPDAGAERRCVCTASTLLPSGSMTERSMAPDACQRAYRPPLQVISK